MTKCFFIVLFLSSVMMVGCSKPKNNNDLPQITSFIVDSIYLPLTINDHQILKIKEVKNIGGDREVIAFVKELNNKLYTYDISKGFYLDSIDISKYREEYVDFAPMNIDSFIIVSRENKVILVSKNNIKEWNAGFIEKKINKNAYIAYLSATPLHLFGDTVMVTTSIAEHFPDLDKRPNESFLNANYDVVFRLLKDTVQFIAMHNPNAPYLYQQDYYTMAERDYINSEKIIYSFKHSDTISIFDFKTGKEKHKTLETFNFTKNKPFDYSKIGDFKYIMEYEFTQSRTGCGDLYYDRYRHLIYQQMRHKGVYIDSTGKKNASEDIPSSFFVFDEQLNQLKEVYIPPGILYFSQFAFIDKKGLYYAAATSKQKYHDKMLFYRIVFK